MKKFLQTFPNPRTLSALIMVLFCCWGNLVRSQTCDQPDGSLMVSNVSVSNLTVCDAKGNFGFRVQNVNSEQATTVLVYVTLPIGIRYVSGSVTGATQHSSSTSIAPVFEIATLAGASYVDITYQAAARCDVVSPYSGRQNTVILNYTMSGASACDAFDGAGATPYDILRPNLSIPTAPITNQNYYGSEAETFTRCITVANGGDGRLDTFTFTDTHGTGIQVQTVSVGTLTPVGGATGITETVFLKGADFSSIGNHDNYFDPNETIQICETVLLTGCTGSVQSTFGASWGCFGSTNCQAIAAVNNATVFITPKSPIINYNITGTQDDYLCIEQGARTNTITITNTGQGVANDMYYYVYAGNGVYFDASTIKYTITKISDGSVVVPLTSLEPFSSSSSSLNCGGGTTPISYFQTPKIDLQPGQQLQYTWKRYNCCQSQSCGIGASMQDFNSYLYWTPPCGYQTYAYIGTPSMSVNYQLLGSGGAGYLPEGVSSTVTNSVYFQNYGFPSDATAYLSFDITLPACLTLSNPTLEGVAPSSFTTNGNVVTLQFTRASLLGMVYAPLTYTLTNTCNTSPTACTGADVYNIDIKSYFSPSTSCSCRMGGPCLTIPVIIGCLPPCDKGGVQIGAFSTIRGNYGSPDNEANGGNGYPDASGALTGVKTRELMTGDLLNVNLEGTVIITPTSPASAWENVFSEIEILNGSYFTFIGAQLTIQPIGGGAPFVCSIKPIDSTNYIPTKTWKFDLSPATLSAAGCLPPSYAYANGDKITIQPVLKLTDNSFSSRAIAITEGRMYGYDSLENKGYQCLFGFDNVVLNNIYYSAYGYGYGPSGCSNGYFYVYGNSQLNDLYPGYYYDNIFTNEHRPISYPKSVTIQLPAAFDYAGSVSFSIQSTGGNGNLANNQTTTSPPYTQVGNTFTFDLESMFKPFGGTMEMPDENSFFQVYVYVKQDCKFAPTQAEYNKYYPVPFSYSLGLPDQIPGVQTPAIPTTNIPMLVADSISQTLTSGIQTYYFYYPFFTASPATAVVYAADNVAKWNIQIANGGPATNYGWLGTCDPNMNIVSVKDLGTGTTYTPSAGGVFQLGYWAGAKNFEIKATYNGCQRDSIKVLTGWSCTGYPATPCESECKTSKNYLTVIPQPGEIDLNVAASSPSINLCSNITYTLTGKDTQVGSVYDIKTRMDIPPGMTVVPGTSQLSYPKGSAYVTVADPTIVGSQLEWNVSASNATIGTNGIKGTAQSNTTLQEFDLKVQFYVSCGFISGQVIDFSMEADNGCGQPTGDSEAITPQVNLNGAAPSYANLITLLGNQIKPCEDPSTLTVRIRNTGPANWGSADSVYVTLPAGITFIPGSFVAVNANAPVNGVPVVRTVNGKTVLIWKLPAGVAPSGVSEFTFNYNANEDVLACGKIKFKADTRIYVPLICQADGSVCNTPSISGQTTMNATVIKPTLAVSNMVATSTPNSPTGETVTVSYDVTTNSTTPLPAGSTGTLAVYFDTDNSGTYTAGDVLLNSNTNVPFAISSTNPATYTGTFNVSAGQACRLIAVVTPNTTCVCGAASTKLPIPKATFAGADVTICSNQIVQIGNEPISGYSYLWTPNSYLNDNNLSNPTVTTGQTYSPFSINYILTTDRIYCTSADTVKVTVNPAPTISDYSTNTCANNCANVYLGYYSNTWYTWYNNNGSNNSGTDSIPNSYYYGPGPESGPYAYYMNKCYAESEVGSFKYKVIAHNGACSDEAKVEINIAPALVASAALMKKFVVMHKLHSVELLSKM